MHPLHHFLLQGMILVSALWVGNSLGGIGVGGAGAGGLLILYLFFEVPIADPPLGIALMIISIVTTVSLLEAAGSLRLIADYAESIIAYYPKWVNYLAPLITYLLVFFIGTAHLTYALLPIIIEVAKKMGRPPVIPLVNSIVAAQLAILPSPISAPMTIISSQFQPYGYTPGQLTLLFLPATMGGLLCSLLLTHYTIQIDRLPSAPYKIVDRSSPQYNPLQAGKALVIFSIGLLLILLLNSGIIASSPIGSHYRVPLVILATTAAIMFICQIKSSSILATNTFSIGMQSVLTILGVAWMTKSFFLTHLNLLQAWMDRIPPRYAIPIWGFMLLLLIFLTQSQASTLQLLLPAALALHTAPDSLLIAIPMATCFCLLPTYPIIQAAITLDDTKTSAMQDRFGLHPFLLPGLIAPIVSSLCLYLYSYLSHQ